MISENFPLQFFIIFFLILIPAGSHCQTVPYQVLIMEIMADPIPSKGLPETEYVELLNRGLTPVDLQGWKLEIGSHAVILSQKTLEPGSRIVLCDESAAEQFSGTVMPVNLPSILNTGQQLTLKAANGTVIHSVLFSEKWYKNSLKAQGGWSLEMIDPENPCGGIHNWKASEDISGGTPGRENSVLSSNPDEEGPILLRATLLNDSTVKLHFNEPLQNQSLSEISYYSTSKGLLHPARSEGIPPDYSCVQLHYKTFQPNQVYAVSVLREIKDCAGNLAEGPLMAKFSIPNIPDSGDVIINEVLFHGGKNCEFIEFYNHSNKVIDMQSLKVHLLDPFSQAIKKTFKLQGYSYLLFPDGYLVITEDSENLLRRGLTDNRAYILELHDFFSLPDQEGMIMIADTAGRPIDEMKYSETMMGDFLLNSAGVSLERVSPERSGLSESSWYPAAPSYGFCTPGLCNSQKECEAQGCNLILSSEYISPDQDGTDDQITLTLEFHDAGWTGTFCMYSLTGLLVKTYAQNALLGTKEAFTWDGTDRSGSLCPPGLYIFFGELIHPDGQIKKIRKVIPLIMK